MSTYELDDEVVRAYLRDTEYAKSITPEDQPWVKILTALQAQVPIPTPTKPGAIVETERGGLWMLALCGNHWISQHDVGGEHTTAEPDRLSRIIKVLSEGLDL